MKKIQVRSNKKDSHHYLIARNVKLTGKKCIYACAILNYLCYRYSNASSKSNTTLSTIITYCSEFNDRDEVVRVTKKLIQLDIIIQDDNFYLSPSNDLIAYLSGEESQPAEITTKSRFRKKKREIL